jgi:hypothetical protein
MVKDKIKIIIEQCDECEGFAAYLKPIQGEEDDFKRMILRG